MAWPEEARRRVAGVVARRLRQVLADAGFDVVRIDGYDMDTGLLVAVRSDELKALMLTDEEFKRLT